MPKLNSSTDLSIMALRATDAVVEQVGLEEPQLTFAVCAVLETVRDYLVEKGMWEKPENDKYDQD